MSTGIRRKAVSRVEPTYARHRIHREEHGPRQVRIAVPCRSATDLHVQSAYPISALCRLWCGVIGRDGISNGVVAGSAIPPFNICSQSISTNVLLATVGPARARNTFGSRCIVGPLDNGLWRPRAANKVACHP